MSKHSPGPWKVGTYNGDVGHRQNAVRSADGDMIADCGWRFDEDVISANTKLIAAAPELLNAVRFLLSNPDNRISDADVVAANAVIDKATK
jgi:hypothetical protein